MNKYFIIVLLFLGIACQAANKAANTGKAVPEKEKKASDESGVAVLVDKAEKLIYDGKYKQAIDILEKVLPDGRLAGIARGHATVLLARAQRLNGTPAKSVQTLEKLIETKDPLYNAELAEEYLALVKPDEALRALSTYDMKKESPDVLTRVYWVYARSQFAIDAHLKCIDSCKGTLGEIDKYKAQSDPDKRTLDEFYTIAKQAAELMERAQELYDEKNYGADYAGYRKARRADSKGEYDDAIRHYSRIHKGVLAQASAFFIAKCLESKGEEKEALKKHKEIIENDVSSPYAGEAALEIAEHAYVKSGAEDALKHVAWFWEWAGKEEKTDAELKSPEGINEALKLDIIEKTPKNYLDADQYGNLVRTAKIPESIVNGRTSPWYLPLLKTRAAVYRGHFTGEAGDKAKAAEIFKSLPLIGGEVKIISDKGTIDSLLEGLAEGFPGPLSAECAKKIGKDRRNALALVCLKGIVGDTKDVISSLKALAGGASTEEREYEKRAILYCLSHYYAAEGNFTAAETALRSILKEKKKIATPLDDKIDVLLAGILARNPNAKDEAASLYRKVADRRGESAPSALLSLAVMLANQGDRDGAAEACVELLRRYSTTPEGVAGTTLVNAVGISEKVKQKAKLTGVRIPVQADGKLIQHVRTIVVPGKTNWEIDPEQLKSGDIVQYNIRCLSRDNCSVIRSFAVSVNPMEPQPPRSKTNQIVFYRAPVLSLPGLSRDFNEAFSGKK